MSCKEDINYLRVVTLAKSVTYFLTACRARASKHTVPPADQLLKPLASRLSFALPPTTLDMWYIRTLILG